MIDNDEFFDECLREHNKYRKLHRVEPLRHSIALDKTAQEWAETLFQRDNVTNSPLSNKGEIGESISKRTSTSDEVDISGSDLTAQWYNDIRSYDFDCATGPAGNFTQMVWAATREVGFGKACGNGRCVVVAHYRPPGNVRGRYKNNVFPRVDGKANELSNPGPEHIAKKSVTRGKRVDAQGQERTVVREVIETKNADGNIHRRIIESFVDEDDSARYSSQQNGLLSPQAIPPRPSKQSLLEFSEDVLKIHNRYRRLHGAPDLVLRSRLNAMAQEWAEFLVDEICLSNSGFTIDGVRLGENITSRWSNGELEESANDVVSNWYQESSRFKYGREPVSIQGVGNFTQLVWASSRNLGVGRATRIARNEESTAEKNRLLSSKIVVVCFYFPPGNVASYFNDNVHPPLVEEGTSGQSTSAFTSNQPSSLANAT
ncbi:Golgi-associated plant pathogenesis-related protein [Echinococcus granulosus]|uniref:Golgi-associated plant pathogenesis-related protein n=1 Tax=Echinococcus granulosus TaxID=6210 RepID=W6U3B0_ECHGR|nr:Golgi-associated plant pathogenesis-related protein [Echinococcus granulosus]EUB55613.1 Golgi-associated plant pathogenesis-related protein [Echinococcus granulosus]